VTKARRTDAGSAATSTASQRSSKSMREQFLALRENLQNGTHNPFQKADPVLLEKIERAIRKEGRPENYEDAPL